MNVSSLIVGSLLRIKVSNRILMKRRSDCLAFVREGFALSGVPPAGTKPGNCVTMIDATLLSEQLIRTWVALDEMRGMW